MFREYYQKYMYIPEVQSVIEFSKSLNWLV